MLVSEIIKQVRWCIDKETRNDACLVGDANVVVMDDLYLDNIIKAHIYDALFWCSIYASAQLLGGSDTSSEGGSIIIHENIAPSQPPEQTGRVGSIRLSKPLVRLVMLKLDAWNRGVGNDDIIAMDSDDYVQLWDDTACASINSPKVCVTKAVPQMVEVYPYAPSGWITYITTPDAANIGSDASDIPDSADIFIPSGIRTGFVYYLAYLALSAYGDSSADAMLKISQMNIGFQQS